MDSYKRVSASLSQEEYKDFEKLIKDFNKIKNTNHTKNSFIKLCIKICKKQFYKKFVNNQ